MGYLARSPKLYGSIGAKRRSIDNVTKEVVQLDRVIIRFAGDSGDGMQLTGDRFTTETAVHG